ncbi:hypothetical protein B0H12DRAFT_1078846 [Mycena haematopus]|nr:hypothetical protein B0H12DRAFT_1078846 [Mycena haematopus]
MDSLARARLENFGLSLSRRPHHAAPPPPRAVRGSPPPRTRRRENLNQVNISRTGGPQSPRQVHESSELAPLVSPDHTFPPPPSAVLGVYPPTVRRTRIPLPPADFVAADQLLDELFADEPLTLRRIRIPPRPDPPPRPQASTPPHPRPDPPRRTIRPPRPQASTPLRSILVSRSGPPPRPQANNPNPPNDLIIFSASALEELERVEPRTPDLERTGLCVICQDEEAIMAAVDCG